MQELQRDFHHAVCEQHATQSNQRVQELRDEWRRQQKSTEEVVAEQYATHGPAQELLTALKEEWHAEQREHAKQAVTTVREELGGSSVVSCWSRRKRCARLCRRRWRIAISWS